MTNHSIGDLPDATTPLADQTWIATAEGVDDDVKRPVSEVFDPGGVLDRHDIAHAEGSQIRRAIQRTRVGGTIYRRTNVEPAHDLKYRSSDRWTADGDSDSTNGGWHEIYENRLFANDIGAFADDITDNSDVINNAIYYLYRKGGGALNFGSGTYRAASIHLRDGVELVGAGKSATHLKLLDGANSHLIWTDGYEAYGDDIARSYTWNSSTTARNAEGRPVGQYKMIAAGGSTDFQNATWWLSINGPATTNADWVEVPSVVGARSAGVRDMTIDGNALGQDPSCDKSLFAYYGIDGIYENAVFVNGCYGPHIVSPGAAYSVLVGQNLQHSGRTVETYNHKGCCFHLNGQSDQTWSDILIYQATDSLLGFEGARKLAIFGPKSGGNRFVGGHIWGGEPDAYIEQRGFNNQFIGVHRERPMHLYSVTLDHFHPHYRLSTDVTDGPAYVFANAAASGSIIEARISNFRYVVRFDAAPGSACAWRIDHFYSPSEDMALRDPASTANFLSVDEVVYNDRAVPSRSFRSANRVRRGELGLADQQSATTGFGIDSTGNSRVVISGSEAMVWTALESISRLPIRFPSYTVATLPSVAADYAFIVVTDGNAGSPCLAWRRAGQWRMIGVEGAIVSSS